MVTDRDGLDELVGALARVDDADLASAADSSAAKALLEEVVSMDVSHEAYRPTRRQRFARHRLVAMMTAGLLFLLGAGYAASVYLTPDEQLSVFDRVSGEIPLPPGGNFDLQRANIEAYPALEEEKGLAGDLAVASTCQWYGYWLDGYNRGDGAQMSGAAETIDRIPSWPQLAAVDPGAGGPVELMQRIARSVDAGDPALVRQFLRANCDREPWAESLGG